MGTSRSEAHSRPSLGRSHRFQGRWFRKVTYAWLNALNIFVCRLMYGVRLTIPSPLPFRGAALLVCDHTSLGDPLVLLASAGRPIRFLMAEEIFSHRYFHWAFEVFGCIPIRRGERDIKAVKMMLKGLKNQEVIGVFPEGGLDRHRLNEGHPGIGYLALKSGVPVVPASILWDKPRSVSSIFQTLFIPCRARVQYGEAICFPQEQRPSKEAMEIGTRAIMRKIEELHQILTEQNTEREYEG